jgi:hypothetical protein
MREPESGIVSSVPQSVLRASAKLTTIGYLGFWIQIVVGAFAIVTFLFASLGLTFGQDRTQGIEAGILSAFISLVLLGVAIYFSIRYRQIGNQLQKVEAASHPRKADILKFIRWGIIVNLAGMGMAIIGAAAIGGIVLAKSLSIAQGTLATNPKQLVTSIDLLAVQANTNTIIAHFTGLASSLWLLDRLDK